VSQELQAIATSALALLVPAITAVVVAYLGKVKRDLDSAFAKIRVHEDELGIKTTQDKHTKEQHVSRSPRSVEGGSIPPQPLDSQGGKGG